MLQERTDIPPSWDDKISYHRWVRHQDVPDYLRCGWVALPTLDETHHGVWAAHCVWLCDCPKVEPEALMKSWGFPALPSIVDPWPNFGVVVSAASLAGSIAIIILVLLL